MSESMFDETGYAIINGVYTAAEIESICNCITPHATPNDNKGLYAIRNVLQGNSKLLQAVFTDTFKNLVASFGDGYFLSKSIYFDKPPLSNWFVAWHQDITINVKEKINTEGFINWTEKEGVISVQPPLAILENTVTVRIHLDDTDENNGALRIVSASHKKGVVRTEYALLENEISCNVQRGGVMLMKPLLFHASRRTTNNKQRRVLHLEFCNLALPNGLQWTEILHLAR